MTRDAGEMERQPDGPWYYEQQALGYNVRMTDVQAALGLSQLGRIEEMHARREAIAARYDGLLAALPVLLPPRLPACRSAWHLYVIEIDDARTGRTRLDVFEKLRAAGIGVNVHYIPIHTQPFYQRLGFRHGGFPFSERYYARAISLPLYPALSEADQDKVVATLAEALG
jgi:dTDP-4-amino-4,6-dideoxygalactose transaminase